MRGVGSDWRLRGVTSGLALAAVLVLAACGAAGPVPPSASSVPSPSSSPSPSPSRSAAPSPAPVVTPEPSVPDAMTAEARADVVDAIRSGNTAALDGRLAATVDYALAASEHGGALTPVQLIDEVTPRLAGAVWEPADAAFVAQAQASFYGPDWFSADVIVLRSSLGDFIALDPKGGPVIVSVLFGNELVL